MANEQAREARDEGIATATSHADRIDPTWRDRAYKALVAYAETHPTFTIEQLRRDLGDTLDEPPSLRAWGGIAMRANRARVLEHFGWAEAQDPAVHCNVIRVWKSLKYRSNRTAEDLMAEHNAVPDHLVETAVRAYNNCCGPHEWRLREAFRVALGPFNTAKEAK